MLEASDFEDDEFDSSLGDDEEEEVMERKLAEELVDDHGPDLTDSEGSGQEVVPRIQTNNFMSLVEPQVAENIQDVPKQINSGREPDQTTPSRNSRELKDKIDDQIRNHLMKPYKASNDKKNKKKSGQIQEIREQYKQELELRMSTERELRGSKQLIASLREALTDIDEVLTGIMQKESIDIQQACGLSDDENSVEEKDENEMVQTIVSRIFEIQRHSKSNASSLTHELSLNTLKLQDLQSLSMDLEILQEEKVLTETEHSKEIQSLFGKIKTLEQDKMKVGQEAYDLKFKIQKLDSDKAQEIHSLQSFVENLENQSKQNEQRWDRRLEDLKSRYENEILPELANSHNRVVSQIKLEVDQNKDRAITLESENTTLTQRV